MTTEAVAPEEPSIALPSLPPGRLTAPCRAALVHLLAKGCVLKRTKPEHFDTLLSNRRAVDEVLADLELRAHVDEGSGMVVLRNQDGADGALAPDVEDEGDDDRPALIRRQRLSLYQSFVVLILRRYHRDRSLAGDNTITIEVEQIEQALVPFMPLIQSQTREEKRLNGAITLCKRHGILANVRGNERRYEILPTIRLVVDIEWLDGLLQQYRAMAERASQGASHG